MPSPRFLPHLRPLPLLILATALALAAPAVPKPRGADQALAERSRGSSLPLDRIVNAVGQALPGRLLEAELDEDDGILVYELKWLLPDGRRLEIEIEAHSGIWLELKGARLETAFRKPLPVQAPR